MPNRKVIWLFLAALPLWPQPGAPAEDDIRANVLLSRDIMAGSFAVRKSKTIPARSCEAGRHVSKNSNKIAMADSLPRKALHFANCY